MRNPPKLPKTYRAHPNSKNSYQLLARTWSVVVTLALLWSVNVDVGSAAAEDHQMMDTGFEQTSTEVSIDETEIVPLSAGDTMLILENVPLGIHVEVRSKNNDVWSEPIDIDSHGDEGPDATQGEGSTDNPFVTNIGPIWLGDDATEIELHSSIPVEITVTFLRPSTDSTDQEKTRVNGARIIADQPTIQPRTAWAIDGWAYETSDCEDGPEMGEQAKAIVVHHTATPNNYSESEVVEIIRGIYHFHVNINGWCDIGYNFVVDRFGTLWEARSGGTDNPVIGGHARGFNTNTSGIALLGQHHEEATPTHAAPSTASKEAIAKFAAWKLSLGDVLPTDQVDLVNQLDDTVHELPAIVGHNDVNQTSCPGNLTLPFVDDLPQLATRLVSNNSFVNALSETFDARPLHDSEISFWQSLAERDGYESVANRFARSEYNVGRVVDRLYQTAFGRAADAQGRAEWISRIRSGATYQQVALHFYGSDEISRRYPDDSRYVTQLYRSVLGREPEARGKTDWTQVLQSQQQSRYEVAERFIQSNEGRKQRVSAMYLDVLERPADSAGLTAWAGYLATGDDFSLAARFAVSNEYQKNI